MDRPGITMAVFQSPGSNAREVIIEAKKVLDENSKMFPTGVKYKILVDANEFLDSSISKVLTTLFEAFILVFIVVFVFLQNFRATLIPAIPVTFVTGTTGVFYKQFGITLAVAIVISAINALTLSPALCAIFLKPHTNNAL